MKTIPNTIYILYKDNAGQTNEAIASMNNFHYSKNAGIKIEREVFTITSIRELYINGVEIINKGEGNDKGYILASGKQESARICVYCNDSNDQKNLFEENNYSPYTGMESTISINRQLVGKHFISADLWGGSNCVADFEIFYCPKCGRKF